MTPITLTDWDTASSNISRVYFTRLHLGREVSMSATLGHTYDASHSGCRTRPKQISPAQKPSETFGCPRKPSEILRSSGLVRLLLLPEFVLPPSEVCLPASEQFFVLS